MVLILCNFRTRRNLADTGKGLHWRTSAADGLQGAPLPHEAGREQRIPPRDPAGVGRCCQYALKPMVQGVGACLERQHPVFSVPGRFWLGGTAESQGALFGVPSPAQPLEPGGLPASGRSNLLRLKSLWNGREGLKGAEGRGEEFGANCGKLLFFCLLRWGGQRSGKVYFVDLKLE